MSPAQREIAAKMIEARGFKLETGTDPDALAAAAFVFDQGILFLPDRDRLEVIAMLRKSQAQEPSDD